MSLVWILWRYYPWETLCHEILNAHDALEGPGFKLSSPRWPQKGCALIAFIHCHPSYSPGFSYIGVSKPSCKPCYHWISAYNQESNRPRYYTQGYRDKWYLGWRSPSLAHVQKRFDERFTKMIGQDFCDQLVDRGLGRFWIPIAQPRASSTKIWMIQLWFWSRKSCRCTSRLALTLLITSETYNSRFVGISSLCNFVTN
jgi:hypothetical protein